MRHSPMDAIIQPLRSSSSRWEQHRICRVHGGQRQPEPPAPEHVAGGEEKEECEGDWDKEKAARDWYESATVDPAGDLVWCQNANSGSRGGRNPGTPRDGKGPLDGSISQTTWKVTGKCDEEWKGEHRQKVKIARERTQKTLQENSQGRDPSTFEGRGHQAERWKRKKKKRKKKVKHREKKWWKKCKALITGLKMM